MSSRPKPIAIIVVAGEILLCILIYFFCVYLRRRYLQCKIDRTARQQYCFDPSETTVDVRAVVPVQYPQELTRTQSSSSKHRRRHSKQGLDPSIVNSFPVISYSSIRALKADRNGLGLDCALCLNPFKEDEDLRLLPMCHHVFHPECVDPWFAFRSICPYCQVSLKPPLPSRCRRTKLTSTGEGVTVAMVHGSDDNKDGEVEAEEEAAGSEMMKRGGNERYMLKLTSDDFLRQLTVTSEQKYNGFDSSGHVILTIGESFRSEERNPVDRHLERG